MEHSLDRPSNFLTKQNLPLRSFGGFLSHAEVWRKVAMGTAPYGICLEDDIEFNKSAFGRCLLGISGNSFDVIYVNERLSGRFGGRRSSTKSLKVQ